MDQKTAAFRAAPRLHEAAPLPLAQDHLQEARGNRSGRSQRDRPALALLHIAAGRFSAPGHTR